MPDWQDEFEQSIRATLEAEIERLRAENRILAKAIVYGDEAFSDSAEWEAILQVAETINSQT